MDRDREYAPDDLVPVSVAAHLLGISAQTMRRLGDHGVVRMYRTPTGRHRRFRYSDVQAAKDRMATNPSDLDDESSPEGHARDRPALAHSA